MSDSMEVDSYTSPIRNNRWRTSKFLTPGSSGKKSNSQINHRLYYKTPPRLYQNYREKCISALNSRRQERQAKLIESFRKVNIQEGFCMKNKTTKDNIVREVMEKVWKEFNEPDIFIEKEILWYDTEFQYFLNEIENELSENEAIYWENLIHENCQEEFDWMIQNQNSVVCFACQKHLLSLQTSGNKTQIFCTHCNFQCFIEFLLSMEQLNNGMIQIIEDHNSKCTNILNFEPVHNLLNITSNIKVYCQCCDFRRLLF